MTPTPPHTHTTTPPANHHDPLPLGSDEERTAYALGEHEALSPERHATITSRITQDDAARSQIENDQETAAALTNAFADESNATDLHLTDAQRHAITAMAHASNPTPWYRSRPFLGSIAAILIIGVGIGFALPRLNKTRRSAQPMDRYAYANVEDAQQSRSNVDTHSPGDDRSPNTLTPATTPIPAITGTLSEKNEPRGRQSQIKSRVESESNQSPVEQTSTDATHAAGREAGEAIVYSEQRPDSNEKKLLDKQIIAEPIGTRLFVTTLSDNGSQTNQPINLPPNQLVLRQSEHSPRPDSLMLADKTNQVVRIAEMDTIDYATAASTSTSQQTASQPKLDKTQRRGLSRHHMNEIVGGNNIIQMPVEPAHPNAESYDAIIDNAFTAVTAQPLSTFSIDVDTASYANVRRFLTQGQRPPRHAVRIEEMVNYFNYQLTAPANDTTPFNTQVEVATCPWQPDHRLVKIGIQGYKIPAEHRPASNLVFLIDVSGSMSSPDKLPLLKTGFRMLVDQLREGDRVSIVVYAGASGLVLDSTDASNKQIIMAALDRLNAGGSTNGGAGIQLAYDIATRQFITGGINRVILATDGDFNVGITDRNALVELVKQRAASNVYLTILGFGRGNLKDATMEQLTNHGDGTYAYIDSLREAQRVLVDQVGATLHVIAKDVKIQVEFNPKQVASYRLIGYENRILANEDFNNDTVDAGDIGAGHSVVALYQVVPIGSAVNPVIPIQPMRYQQSQTQSQTERVAQNAVLKNTVPNNEHTDEMLAVNIRYKAPDAPKQQGTSKLLVFPVQDSEQSFEQASDDFKFAAAVAGFGMILRDSPHVGSASLDNVESWAKQGLLDQTHDPRGDRLEFVTLVQHARSVLPNTR